MEKALAAIRSGDVDGIAYAEMQPTSLYLLEKSDRIHELLQKRFGDLAEKPALQQSLNELADSDYELACVISGFLEAVFDLVNGKPPPSDAGPPTEAR
ncbi:MAG: hypothetical protein NTW19_16920, partial [Planctomycetota bacterium]|nr:hypothetical protein [Planctomycetota bacterium]